MNTHTKPCSLWHAFGCSGLERARRPRALPAASWNSGPENKSFGFVQYIWMSIIEHNMSDRPAEEDSLVSVEALEDNSSDEYSKLSVLPFLL